jgi:hypothetical protein
MTKKYDQPNMPVIKVNATHRASVKQSFSEGKTSLQVKEALMEAGLTKSQSTNLIRETRFRMGILNSNSATV